MPTINKLPKKARAPRNNTEHRTIRQKAYNSSKWKNLRDIFIKEHPLCENCLKKGKVTPAEDIHHIKSPFSNNSIDWNLLLDYNNLKALCKNCHNEEHQKQKNPNYAFKSPQQVLDELEALFNNNIKDEDLE